MVDEIVEIILKHDREYSRERGTYYHAATLAERINKYIEERYVEL